MFYTARLSSTLGYNKNMKFDHIQLAMPEGQESQARLFFGGILGMTEEEKPYPLSDKGGCWFRSGEVIIHIGVDRPFRAQKKAHPAFLIENLDVLAKKLIDAGYDVSWDEALSERRRFYSTDPFKNRIEFMADGDGFGQKP